MKINELKIGDTVFDSWYYDWGMGTVTKVLKTVVYINFTIRGEEKYDKSHVQFLESTQCTKQVCHCNNGGVCLNQ